MRRKLTITLAVEALLLIVFCMIKPFNVHYFSAIMAFPFKQLGMMLRKISLYSYTGNIISIIIYSVICLLPGTYLMFRLIKSKAHAEDGLLALLSLLLFFIIYLMINPADIVKHFGSSELLEANKAFLGVVIYSIAAGYCILRIMRVFANSETNAILKYLKVLLAVICIVLTYGVFGSGLMGLFSTFQQLAADNTGAGQGLNLSYLFLVLQYIVNVLPLVLGIFVIYTGLELIEEFRKDPYSREMVLSVQKTGQFCRKAAAWIILSQISVNVLQLILGSRVRSSHYTLSIPIVSVVFVLIAMLLANYFEQVRQLKSDNEMFI
jgi:hypothetical protein